MAITTGGSGPRRTETYVEPEKIKTSPIKLLSSATGTANKALKAVDKVNVSKLKKSGYLTSQDYKLQLKDGTTINMFEDKPWHGKYIKGHFRKVGERIQFTDDFKVWLKDSNLNNEEFAQHLTDMLKEEGMGLSEIGPLMEDVAPGYKVKFIDSPALLDDFEMPMEQYFDELDELPLDDTLLKKGDFNIGDGVIPKTPSIPGTIPKSAIGEGLEEIAQVNPGSIVQPNIVGTQPTGPIGGMLRNKFVAQPGLAQGPAMQTWKALKYGTKGAGGPGFFQTLFPGAGGAAAGTTAATTGAATANTGLMAGMGPLGWTMLAGSLLGQLGVFKKHTLLGKIFSDERLKNNIITVGKSKTGIPIKEFRYNGLEGLYRGVISKDVPWAISRDNASGYDMVDYSKIDVPFERIK